MYSGCLVDCGWEKRFSIEGTLMWVSRLIQQVGHLSQRHTTHKIYYND